VIREHHAGAERERRLSPPVLAALHDAVLLRLCTPRALGGLEADPLTRALAIEEISGHDTAAGWTLANPLDQAYLCARLPDAGAEETRGRGANVVIAGQFGRPLQAAPAQEEYRTTGARPSSATAMTPTGLPRKPRWWRETTRGQRTKVSRRW
jgi:alkylation response protein AidB-like acyl-CoA dehydrogenase